MLRKLAGRISSYYIRKSKVDIADKEIYDYCFEVLLSTILNLFAILVLAIVTKLYLETLCFIITFMALRGSTGGVHAKTHLGCFISLIIVFAILPICFKFISVDILRYIGISFASLGCIFIFALSPVDNINRPFEKFERRKFRKRSITLTLIAALIFAILISFNATIKCAFAIGFVILVVSVSLILGFIKNYNTKTKTKYKINGYTD